MWSDIIHEFSDSPSQSRVVRFLLENGFGVSDDGRISCNGIEMPATAVAKAIGSDRRVVDATAKRILERPMLRDIFLNHTYHHRGQLGVYLRLLGVPVPSTFGPSADESVI